MTVKSEPSSARWGRQILLLIVALTAALYLRTLARGLLAGDSGEFQMAAWRFGVAHATGYPLYLLLGGAWQHLWSLFGVSPALSLNALSAVFGVVCVAIFYAVTARWLEGPPAIRRAAAALAAAWLATNPTFWSQALIAEVYTLHALFLVLILGALQRIEAAPERSASPMLLFLLAGLSFAHHATTVLFAPGLVAALWVLRKRLTASPGLWILAVIALLAPLLLYLYVPLRATPAASPWYFPHVGGETLALYAPGWKGFRDFVSGRSISVGFYGTGEALGNIGAAFRLWRLHFGWVGLALIVMGLYSIARGRRWALLLFTAISAVCLQLFNLYYAIGDILVYYIPLYVIGSLWVGFGACALGNGFAEFGGDVASPDAREDTPRAMAAADAPPTRSNWQTVGVALILMLLYFPLRQAVTYLPNLDQSHERQVEQMWAGILAAELPQDAVLVSNDRNEIVPLYYKQYVEGTRPDLTGLFPLMAPQPRFGDVGSTVATALESGAAVYLIKSMPGLESRFALEPQPPLVRVTGPAVTRQPEVTLNQPYGPLTLLGFDRKVEGDENTVRLYWRVNTAIPAAYTTTVQLFDASGKKVAQDDAAAGGLYYPTSLWKAGEVLTESHTLAIPAGVEPASLLVGMYTGAALTPLAPPLMVSLEMKTQ